MAAVSIPTFLQTPWTCIFLVLFLCLLSCIVRVCLCVCVCVCVLGGGRDQAQLPGVFLLLPVPRSLTGTDRSMKAQLACWDDMLFSEACSSCLWDASRGLNPPIMNKMVDVSRSAARVQELRRNFQHAMDLRHVESAFKVAPLSCEHDDWTCLEFGAPSVFSSACVRTGVCLWYSGTFTCLCV